MEPKQKSLTASGDLKRVKQKHPNVGTLSLFCLFKFSFVFLWLGWIVGSIVCWWKAATASR